MDDQALPHLSRTLGSIAYHDRDREFLFGLHALLTGLEDVLLHRGSNFRG